MSLKVSPVHGPPNPLCHGDILIFTCTKTMATAVELVLRNAPVYGTP